MQDLTRGPIPLHLIRLAAPIAAGMLFQTMYHLIDLYFVAQLGDTAIAGVSAAGGVQFVIVALTQTLGIGTTTLIAHACGRGDQFDANRVFNQSLRLAAIFALVTLIAGIALAGLYMRTLGADIATVTAGTTYLYWFLPGLAMQFPLIAMGSALRGTGIVKPAILVQILSVVLNALLAPVLIAGWLTGVPFGVAGAGLATTISVAFGALLMFLLFTRFEHYVSYDAALFRGPYDTVRRILRIGLPAGGEFLMMFVFMALIYWLIRDFGATAQAGFGAGQRIMQAIFLPAMAVAFATAPIAGQNFGAGHADRVKQTFVTAIVIGSVIMMGLTVLCQWRPELLIAGLTSNAAVVAVGGKYLQITSWNFVALGIIFTCSGLFQALGNTVPALLSSASRLLFFLPPALWLVGMPWLELHHFWALSVATVGLQAVLSLSMLKIEFTRRLGRLQRPPS